jgi:hypothetical protein
MSEGRKSGEGELERPETAPRPSSMKSSASSADSDALESRSSDRLHELPHSAAWILSFGRAISRVLLVKVPGSTHRVVEMVEQGTEGGIREHLVAAQELFRAILGSVASDPGRLVFEVQDEPQLEAGVRYCYADAVGSGQRNRLGDIRVFVDIEHAPNLVVGAISPPPFLLGLLPHARYCVLDELKRTSTKWVHSYDYLRPVTTVPVDEVPLLGLAALHEDEQLSADRVARDCASRASRSRTHEPSPTVISSATASNS